MKEEVTLGHIKVLKTEIKHIHKILDLQDKALKLQAEEYDKHLEALNGEASKLHNMQLKYILREVYEVQESANRKNIESLRIRLDLMTGKSQGVKDFRDWIPWIITVIMFLLYLWKK